MRKLIRMASFFLISLPMLLLSSPSPFPFVYDDFLAPDVEDRYFRCLSFDFL
jgi:hypothetical protein